MDEYDVAVVGAGPAGSVTAEGIAKEGWRTVLLEKSAYPGKDAVCGGMITLRDTEEFGIDQSLIEKRLFSCVTYYPWGSRVIRFPESAANIPITIQRKHLDRHLAEKAVRAGAELRTRCRVRDVRRLDTGRMILDVVDDGIRKEIASKLVVFADGPITLAQRCFGIGFTPKPHTVAVSVICDFEYPDNPMDFWASYYVPRIATWGFGWIFPFAHHLHLGLCFLRSEIGNRERVLLDRLEFMLNDYAHSSTLVGKRRMISRRGALIPMELAARIHGDSCLVVGDAAGLVGAFSGSGIAYAMHSGRAAARTADEALRKGDFSAAFLSSYPARWQKTRKYKALKVMDVLKKILLVVHRVDPQALNKLMFLFGVIRSGGGPDRLRWHEMLRILFYPALGNPCVKTTSVVPPRKRL